ncbi:MAG: MarR family transcriptional regulator [Atopobiaceae bacterium]|nr:MarR family transcriptional regulator [Atopobiaceae bacterium]MCI2172857.1 MarR family transcriptional regulator [Atopobiaceae bacterium]MCI2207164.1 MarR family transcriptional regulator [Atopobiaceae bacterium]
MEIREYLSVRKAYNLVRQSLPSEERLTFEEFSMLCHLSEEDRPLNTSAIADYQGVLRPTMTHRSNHLAGLGLIDRAEGLADRRNVCVSISDAGMSKMNELSDEVSKCIPQTAPLGRAPGSRIIKYADAMGSVFCMAGDLILLALDTELGGSSSVTGLVDCLGFLQPTISMSVSTLTGEGLVERNRTPRETSRTVCVAITHKGSEAIYPVECQICDAIVRRSGKRRSDKEGTAE